jgi:5-methyltetrahydropteroyltriglutamate--homocysteine methyltransferase
VPRIVGPIRRLWPVEVHDVEFLRANTDRKIKITPPGPFTMSRQAKNEFYKDEEELVMDYAAAVNAELRDLKAAGADVIQLDEPWLQARAEEAWRLALRRSTAPSTASRGDGTAPLLWLCLCRPRQAERLCIPSGADSLEGRADLDRGRPAQPRPHDPRRARRQDRDLWRD